MNISLEFILDSFGLDSPLIRTVLVLMNKFSGIVVVHGVNLIFSVLNVRTLNLKLLNKHFRFLCLLAKQNNVGSKMEPKTETAKTTTLFSQLPTLSSSFLACSVKSHPERCINRRNERHVSPC